MLIARCVARQWMVLALAVLVPLSVQAQTVAPPALLDGWLTDEDPPDTVNKKLRAKVHEVLLNANDLYFIEVRGLDFPAGLRIEDAAGKKILENNGMAMGLPAARLGFKPRATGKFRVIALSAR